DRAEGVVDVDSLVAEADDFAPRLRDGGARLIPELLGCLPDDGEEAFGGALPQPVAQESLAADPLQVAGQLVGAVHDVLQAAGVTGFRPQRGRPPAGWRPPGAGWEARRG